MFKRRANCRLDTVSRFLFFRTLPHAVQALRAFHVVSCPPLERGAGPCGGGAIRFLNFANRTKSKTPTSSRHIARPQEPSTVYRTAIADDLAPSQFSRDSATCRGVHVRALPSKVQYVKVDLLTP